MSRKTDGERIDDLLKKVAELDLADAELEKTDALLTLRVVLAEGALVEARGELRDATKQLAELQRATEGQIAALRLDYETKLADIRRAHEAETKLLRQQVEELKQEQLRWGARLWQVAIAVVVVVVGAALTTYLGLKK